MRGPRDRGQGQVRTPARVLIVAPHYPPDTIAAAIRLGSLAAELAALGHAVVVVAAGHDEGNDEASNAHAHLRVLRVTVGHRRRGMLGNALHQVALNRALGRGIDAALQDGPLPDAMIVSTPPPLAALAGLARARRHRLPLIVDVRDIWPDVLIEAGALRPWSPAAWILGAIESRLLGSAAHVTVVTATKAQRLRSRTGAPISLVPNGVDAAWCEGGELYGGGGDDGEFEVLHAGNLGLAQDVSLLADAVGSLARAAGGGRTPARRIHAVIVGSGEDSRHVAAAAMRAGACVRMHPPESREAVRARLSRSGCAFISLRTAALVDAVPSKLLEAMAVGVPVVAAVAGEAAALIREADAGLVTPPGDAMALAQALVTMAGLGSDARRAMGRRGRQFVLARYRRERAALEMSRVLGQVCAKRGLIAAEAGA